MTKEQFQQLLTLRTQASALRQQFDILNAQWAALHGQIETLCHSIADEMVMPSGPAIAERIFKKDEPSARHFMEPSNAEEVSGADEELSRTQAVEIRTTDNRRGPRNGGSDKRRQGGSA